MRNKEQWKPTKFILDSNGKLEVNPTGVKPGSHFIANLTAEKLQNKINIHAHGHLLDLGCGFVPLYSVYQNKASEVTCIDWENSLHKNPYLDFVHDVSKPLPLPDCSIDTLVMSDVLEHIPNPQEVFQELARILKPNGYLIMNTPFAYVEHEAPYDFYRYTRYALEKFARDNHFEDIKIEPIGDALGVLCDILSKAIIEKPVLNLLPKILIKFTLRRYHKNKYFMSQMPLGYVLTCKKIG